MLLTGYEFYLFARVQLFILFYLVVMPDFNKARLCTGGGLSTFVPHFLYLKATLKLRGRRALSLVLRGIVRVLMVFFIECDNCTLWTFQFYVTFLKLS